MTIQLSVNVCFNRECQRPLDNGNNCGGFKAVKTRNGWATGYTCNRCSQGSAVGTQKLALFQQTHHYTTPPPKTYHNLTNKTIKHKREWNHLITTIQREEEKEEKQNNATKMPTWQQIQPKQKEGKKE